MAFGPVATAQVVYDLVDETSTHAKMKLHFPTVTLVATADAAAAALVPLIQAITGCTVLSYGLTYASVDDNPSVPAVGSRIEDKGRFIFRLADGLTTRVEVPGILESTLNGSGSIDVANTDIVAFLDAIINSPAIFRGVQGSDITALKAAYQAFRRSTKNMLPSDRAAFGGA